MKPVTESIWRSSQRRRLLYFIHKQSVSGFRWRPRSQALLRRMLGALTFSENQDRLKRLPGSKIKPRRRNEQRERQRFSGKLKIVSNEILIYGTNHKPWWFFLVIFLLTVPSFSVEEPTFSSKQINQKTLPGKENLIRKMPPSFSSSESLAQCSELFLDVN